MSQFALTFEMAQKLVAAACAEAGKQGLGVSAVVVDRGGHMVAAGRMDGVSYATAEIARRKAATAAGFAAPLSAIAEMTKSDPLIATVFGSSPELLAVPGGMPVMLDGVAIGGLGISGGHYAQDQGVAEAAVRALG